MTDDMRELIGAYALDAVDASEAKAVEVPDGGPDDVEEGGEPLAADG